MLASTDSQITYQGNGETDVAYEINFPLVAASHLVAIKINADGTETTLSAGLFTFTPETDGNGRITGGEVVTDPAIPDTADIRFKRVTPRTQTLNFTAGGSFQAEALESGLDKIVMILQEIERDYAAADTDIDARLDALEV